MKNADGATSAIDTCRSSGCRSFVAYLVLFSILYANKRSFADHLKTQEAVVVNIIKPKEIGDAIQPTFAEFQDFRAGPRYSLYAAGNSMKDLELKYNQTGNTDPLYAGMCKFEGYFKRKNAGSLYAAAWLSSKETLFKNESSRGNTCKK
jgi:hypothetical protein